MSEDEILKLNKTEQLRLAHILGLISNIFQLGKFDNIFFRNYSTTSNRTSKNVISNVSPVVQFKVLQ